MLSRPVRPCSPDRHFLLYCLIGLSGVTFDFCVYASLVRFLSMHVQLANAIGYASGTVLSFSLNARFNFKTYDQLFQRFLTFCTVAALGWTASAGLLHVAIVQFGVDKYLAKTLTLIAVVLLQYNLNRLVSFRRSKAFDHG